MFSTKTEREKRGKALAFGWLVAMLLFMVPLTASPVHAATTFTVNSTRDVGDNNPGNGVCFTGTVLVIGEECTLRAAIEEANVTTGADTIHFDVPTTGVATISPGSRLPIITGTVIIDGYTQPGASENTLAVGNNAVLRIRLDGSGAGSATGLNITANDSVVRGLSVTGFSFSGGIGLSGADNNRIEGNFLGVAPSGVDVGNGFGLYLQNHFSDSSNKPSDNTVGGTAPAARNIISGNGTGVTVFGGAGNRIQGNLVGTTKSGSDELGNGSSGVWVLGGNNTTIGGTGAARNIIAFNGHDGVEISGNTTTGNRILYNSIFSNGDLGIDLGSGGPTPNDPGDVDTGPNDLQNFPSLSAAETGRRTVVKGSLNSTPSTTFTLQFFSSPTADPSGFGEGRRFLGQRSVTTDASGNASFTFTAPITRAGHVLTATATSATGDTSEFARAIPIKQIKPTIIPLTPKPGSTIRVRTVKIQAVVRDNVTDLAKDHIRLFVDGKRRTNFTYNPTTDRLAFTAKNLSFGRHTVRITATDEAGNVAIRSWVFRVGRR